MSVVPKKVAERIAWYQARQSAWTSNAVALGMSAAEMTTMSGYITDAAAALGDQANAQNAAKAATITLRDADRLMAAYGSDLIKQIRAKAGQTGDSVYALALIPPPATPTPVGPPGTPYQVLVTLNPDGSIMLKWKCDNPVGAPGTFYQIGRRPEGTPTFTYLGGTGLREFTDNTLPAGSSTVIYSIQAMRSTTMGLAAEFLVKFGVTGSGPAITSVTAMTPKMAA